MAKSISIDRTKRLAEEPNKGHNRWHPDINRSFAPPKCASEISLSASA